MDYAAFVKTMINCASCSKTILVTIFASKYLYNSITFLKKKFFTFSGGFGTFSQFSRGCSTQRSGHEKSSTLSTTSKRIRRSNRSWFADVEKPSTP